MKYLSRAVEILTCPQCGAGDLQGMELPEKDGFAGSGAVLCPGCSSIYMVQNRILSMLPVNLADAGRESAFFKAYAHELSLYQSFIDARLISLKQQASGNDVWTLEEKEYWDTKRYAHVELSRFNWNRHEVRREHITRFLEPDISGKLVLDIGCGNASTPYHILNPEKYRYTLVCADISYKGLLAAGRHHPTALLVQCDATNPPFRKEVFDVIFEFGVLHHLPDNTEILKRHITLLRGHGTLGMHEPTDRRPAFLSSVPLLKKLRADESEHNEFIIEQEVLETLEAGGEILHTHIEYSPIRNWLVLLLVDKLKLESRLLHRFYVSVDQLVIKTIGRLWNRMDGNSLLLLWKKG